VQIDPITAAAAGNLLSDALEAVVRRVSGRQRDNLERRIEIQISDSTELAKRLNLAIAASGPLPRAALDRLRKFLTGPEFATVARQLSIAVMAGQLATYEDAITTRLAHLLLVNPEIDEKTAGRVARVCVETLAAVLRSVGQKRLSRAGLDIRATDELLLTHLRNIDRQLEELSSAQLPDLPTLERFTANLRRQIRQRNSRITPPNVKEVRKLSINSIYVAPRLAPFTRRVQRANSSDEFTGGVGITLSSMANAAYRDVILGSPGSGKTTLVTKLCYELAGESKHFNLAGRHPVPLPVTMRSLTAERNQGDVSIVRHIENYITNRLQLEVPNGVIDYLLQTGRAVVLFDGLDELTDTALRRQTTEDVESFCSRYDQTAVIVTSREVGYDQAPLDYESFDVWRLSDFSDEQVEEYARKWFGASSGLNGIELTNTVTSFIDETEEIEDLRSNALLLALLCNLYLGSHYIPRYRPEVYESCANMLFERWDTSRGISVPRLFESNRSGLLTSLAHWIYSTEGLADGVPEDKLIKATADYLYKRRYRLYEDAEAAAVSLVEYCSGRAWVFTDAGTTRSGERLYQFAHRTFMEYFAASYTVRVNMTPGKVWEALRTQVAGGNWDAVSLLTVQILQKTAEDGADRLLRRLLADAEAADGGTRAALLRFSAFCLVVVAVAPELVDALEQCMLEALVKGIGAAESVEPGSPEYSLIDTLWFVLGGGHVESDNQAPLLECLLHRVSLELDGGASTSLSPGGRLGIGLVRLYTYSWESEDVWRAFEQQYGGLLPDDDKLYIARSSKVIREWERGLITHFELLTEFAEIFLQPVALRVPVAAVMK
jgi:GTPase SAR1 family protein